MGADAVSIIAALTLISVTLSTLFVVLFAIRARDVIAPDDPVTNAPLDASLPAVSILKPCAGADDDLENCLRSFCALRYPRFEILCGVRDDTDPALSVLERVRDAHPHIAFRIVRTQQGRSVNPKVAQLEVLEREARFETLWISDSNTRVHPDTLAAAATDLAQPGVGMVLHPVVGVGETTLGAALDNLHISAFITVATYAIQALTGRIIAPGKSTLLRRRSLRAIGGFSELGRYCAEDYVMIEQLRARGEHVVLGRHLVANVNVAGDVAKFYRRHFRWAQMHWLLEWGTALEPALFPVLFAIAWFLGAPSVHTFAMLIAVAAWQGATDAWVLSRLRGNALDVRHAFALWLRPLIFAWLWARSPFAREVVWRGNVRWLGDKTLLLETPPTRLARLFRAR